LLDQARLGKGTQCIVKPPFETVADASIADNSRNVQLVTVPSIQRNVFMEKGSMDAGSVLENHVQYLSPVPRDIAAKLAAAKPVSWRGRGDLPQLPWACPQRGLFLLVDLWSGIGGAIVCLLSMGVRFICLAAEENHDAVACVRRGFPDVVHIPRVEDVCVEMFVEVAKRRNLAGIILGGGAPCQGNSSLNLQRRGLADARTQQPRYLQQLAKQFGIHPVLKHIPLLKYLENVASMPGDVKEFYEQMVGGQSFQISAGQFGWVERRRLIFGSGPLGDVAAVSMKLPEGVSLDVTDSQRFILSFAGKKPTPNRLWIQDGYVPRIDPSHVVKSGGKGAMYPFTREFFHPEDRIHEASSTACQRFYEDSRRFPPESYEENNLLWKQSADQPVKRKWRTYSPAERAQIMMIPPDLLNGVPELNRGAAKLVEVQNSLIGNGYHIPTMMLAFIVLLQLIPVAAGASMTYVSQEEQYLQARLWHTAFQPGITEAFPGVLAVPEVVDLMQDMLDVPAGNLPWQQIRENLATVPIHILQV
jgi:hypothetical protein